MEKHCSEMRCDSWVEEGEEMQSGMSDWCRTRVAAAGLPRGIISACIFFFLRFGSEDGA